MCQHLLTLTPVVNKCKRRHKYIVSSERTLFPRPWASTDIVSTFKFFSSFAAMLCATAPVSVIGTRFAMSIVPFWTPEHFSGRLVPPESDRWSYQVSSSRHWDAFWKFYFRDRGLYRLCAQGVCVRIQDHRHCCSENWLLKFFSENRDKIEVYLTFGASRMEACRPIAKQALRLALTPMISQMR